MGGTRSKAAHRPGPAANLTRLLAPHRAKAPPAPAASPIHLLAASLLLVACADRAVEAPERSDVAFTHVTVLDGTGAPPIADATVVVRDGRIESVAPGGAVPAGTPVVDATGKFLIPGLFEMHGHAALDVESRGAVLPASIAFGVTSVRVAGTEQTPAQVRALRGDIAAGRVLGPRLFAAGRVIEGPEPPGDETYFYVLRTRPDGVAAAESLHAGGWDFIKTYNGVPREALLGLLARARALKVPVGGHLPFAVAAAEASDSGFGSIEHVTGIPFGCSAREAELIQRLVGARTTRDRSQTSSMRLVIQRAQLEALASADSAKCADLFARFARNGTHQVPTLVANRAAAHHTEDSLGADPRLAWVPKSTRDRWNPAPGARKENHAPEDATGERALYEAQARLVGQMHRAGVPIMAGTDVLAHYVFPGASLHDELRLLVEAGLSPMDALRAATSVPARWLGADSLGVIAPGRRADLVLLDADPLADIRNTSRIAGILADGRWIDAAARADLLKRIERIAREL